MARKSRSPRGVLSAKDFADAQRSTDGWGVLVGSAISMARPTEAPSVPAAFDGLLRAIGDRLRASESELALRYDRVIGVINPAQLAATLKFEWAMTHVQAHTQRAAEVITALFGSLPPNPNHEAVAQLRRSGWCRWVITTNFDPGLERTGAFVRVARPGASVADADLLKLHGDPEDPSSLVHTIQTLASGRTRTFATDTLLHLRASGLRSLLVVGYSGYGDMDVLPALRSLADAGVGIWWCVRDPASRLPVDLVLAGLVAQDLCRAGDNVLVALSGVRTLDLALSTDANRLADLARARLGPVAARLEPSTAFWLAVSLLMEAGLATQPAQLVWAVERHSNWRVPAAIQVRVRERMSTYSTALRYARTMTAEATSPLERAAGVAREGFLAQEAGRIGESLRLLDEAAALAGDKVQMSDLSEGVFRARIEAQIERSLRMWRGRERVAALMTLRDSTDLGGWEQALAESAPLSALLWRFSRLRIEYLLAEDATARSEIGGELMQLVRDLRALHHAEAEAGVTRFMLRVGLGRLPEEGDDGPGPGRWHTGRDRFKNRLAAAQGFFHFAPARLRRDTPLAGTQKTLFDLVFTLRWVALRLASRLRYRP